MPMNHSQYNAVRRRYDERQTAARALAERRREEIEQKIPAYAELERQMIENSIRCAKESLFVDAPKETTADTHVLAADTPAAADADTSAVTSAEPYAHTASVSQASSNAAPAMGLSGLRAANQKLSEQKKRLLVEHGFPADYLEPVYVCPDCKDTGMTDSGYCHCFRQAVVDLLYAQSNLKDVLATETFDTFSFEYYNDCDTDLVTGLTPLANMRQIYGTARSFVAEFDHEFKNLLFYGPSGLGKTFLSHCIAGELLNSAHTVLYLTAYQLFETLGKAMRTEETASAPISAEHIFDCDLLILDDLGAEFSTAFTLSRFNDIINERFLCRRSTIISTNLSLTDLAAVYGERNFSRISGNYTPLRFFGEDIRLKKRRKS